jgi:hypothetical protein
MVKELLIYAVKLDSLIVAYIQLVILLIEMKTLLSQELKCLFFARLLYSYLNELYQRLWMWPLTFYCIRNK